MCHELELISSLHTCNQHTWLSLLLSSLLLSLFYNTISIFSSNLRIGQGVVDSTCCSSIWDPASHKAPRARNVAKVKSSRITYVIIVVVVVIVIVVVIVVVVVVTIVAQIQVLHGQDIGQVTVAAQLPPRVQAATWNFALQRRLDFSNIALQAGWSFMSAPTVSHVYRRPTHGVNMLTNVQNVLLIVAEDQVGLDQVLNAKHVEESKRLELGQLSQLEEHVDLIIESEVEQRVQIDGLGKAEAVHQREDTLSDCKLILQVDGAKVEET